jgi:hypothetical protein
VVNNTADNNAGSGIVLDSNTTGNQVHANTTNTNGFDGIRVAVGSTNNVLTANSAEFNLVFDLEDNNPNCDDNVWEGNEFNTANPSSCIQ